MGKRLPKKQLLAEIATEFEQLVEQIDRTPNRLRTKPGLNSAGWSVKDVISHLHGWQLMLLGWIEVDRQGHQPTMPTEKFTWRETPAINDEIYRRFRKKGFAKVWDAFLETHQQMLDLVDQSTDRQLTTLNAYKWTGKSWTLSDYIRANTASHYRWARNKIRRWLKEN